MTPPKKSDEKNRGRFTETERKSESRFLPRHKNESDRNRSHKSPKIAEMVYGFLGNVAVKSERKRKLLANRTNAAQSKRKIRQESSIFQQGVPFWAGSKFDFKTPRKIPLSMDAAIGSRSGSVVSNHSSVCSDPGISTNSLEDNQDIMQRNTIIKMIGDYIKTSVDHDKRREKKYMRKALAFGLHSGYLIPLDKDGHAFRISSSLLPKSTEIKEVKKTRSAKKKVDKSSESLERKIVLGRTASWIASTSDKRQKHTDEEGSRKRVASTLAKTTTEEKKRKTEGNQKREKSTVVEKRSLPSTNEKAKNPSNGPERKKRRGRVVVPHLQKSQSEKKLETKRRTTRRPRISRKIERPSAAEKGDAEASISNKQNEIIDLKIREENSTTESTSMPQYQFTRFTPNSNDDNALTMDSKNADNDNEKKDAEVVVDITGQTESVLVRDNN